MDKIFEQIFCEINQIKQQINVLSKDLVIDDKSNIIEHVIDKKVDKDLFEITKPFLKWVGGKTQIINQVLQSFPTEINDYYEPFIGGGSVLLAFLCFVNAKKINIKGKIYASDLNSNLIGLYENIQKNPKQLINEIKKLQKDFQKCKDIETRGLEHTSNPLIKPESYLSGEVNRNPKNLEEALTSQESFYYFIRKTFNNLSKEERKSIIGSSLFLFLNKTCFRGVYREGPKGFNVPFGNYKNPSIIDESHILYISELIKDVNFSVSSFEDVLTKVKKNDFVYLDPPYAPESTTSFVSYTSDGFSLENHTKLFKICKDIHSINGKFLMSNSKVKLVTDSFEHSDYNIKVIVCRRAIHSKKPESLTNEVLISNF